MKNLIKNVIRSFKNNKISILGLVFLLFFGLGVFCVMSNTTSNIKNEYTSLANKGKLHDFTASELYEIGSASYAPYTKGISYTVSGGPAVITPYDSLRDFEIKEYLTTNDLSHGTGVPEEAGTYWFTVPEHLLQGNTSVRTYHLKLDDQTSTGLYLSYAKQQPKSRLVDFEFRVVQTYEGGVPQQITDLDNIVKAWNAGTTLTDDDYLNLIANNIFHDDYQSFLTFLSKQTDNIYSVMTTTDTPLSLYLDTSEFKDDIEHRFFKSVNVTATKDNIFYKIIDSNPEDTIDTMVLFTDPAGRRGNQLFSTDDWAPYDSQIIFYDRNGNQLEPGSELTTKTGLTITVPSDFNDVATTPLYPLSEVRQWDDDSYIKSPSFLYSQIMQIRFKRMLSGHITQPDLISTLSTLAAIDLNPLQYYNGLLDVIIPPSPIPNAYNTYLADWYTANAETVTISTNGNVVFGWVESLVGTPQTCTISNWTSRFSIVNPQHLEKNNKNVLSPSYLNSFEPYQAWYEGQYERKPSGEIDKEIVTAWFNSLSQDQFSFWINPYTDTSWTSMDYEIAGTDEVITVERGEEEDQWHGIDNQYIASCGGYNEIIWGCGLTPDFMYPVVDISRPTPNTKTECLVYCNDSGYNSIKLAFVNSTVEEYLIARFKPNVNTNRQQDIINKINVWAENNMIFPDNVKCAYLKDDTSNLLNCSGFRVAYLPSLVHVIEVVSAILCSFIGLLCLVICFVIIKRYVENNRVNIGIMRANGIKKWKIGASLLPFALFPALVGGIAAYLTGLGLQAAALSLFKNYWMLPTPLIKFNWISFLACIFVPFIIFSIICFITTMIVLRVNSVELMKAGSEFKTNSFSRIAKKPFKRFGILTRFRVALAFNSISRLLMLAAMSCLTMSSLVFAFTTFDKLNQSRVTNSSQFDYNFNVELTTPTSSGSVYSVYDYSRQQPESDLYTGFGWSDPSEYLFNIYWNTTASQGQTWSTQDGVTSYHQFTKPYSRNFIMGPLMALYETACGETYQYALGHYGNLMIPNMSDSEGQNKDLLYLQDKMSSRLTLDYNVGSSVLGSSNPWEIALALMPANSRNIAADAYNQIANLAGHKYASQPRFAPFFNYDEESDTYTFITDMTTVGYLLMAFNADFIHLLETLYSDPEIIQLEYPIVYGSIPLNWDKHEGDKLDETYTYVSGNITQLSNKQSFDSTHEIKIEGIAQNSQYIKLTDKQGNDLNKWLFDANYVHSFDAGDAQPVIINSYAAHKYKLKTGDWLSVNVTNTVDRFEQQLHSKDYPEDYNINKFVVVGISQGTNDEAFYTTQKGANDILGLPNGETWNKTHRYMMWTEMVEGQFPDWTASTFPKLADLSGIGAENPDNISIYSFANPDGSIVKPVITDGPAKLAGTDEMPITVPVGFNGIYTENKAGKPITNGVALYSYTGMYPGTSVYKSNGSKNKFADILKFGSNLSVANLMSGVNNQAYYQANADYLVGRIGEGEYDGFISDFITDIANTYGDTTMITAICGAMDVAASDLIYSNLISTFDLAETSIMAIIIPITIIIVAIISSLIINDSKKMAAMLKALGYSDAKNLMSILALFIPTIVIGLGLAVPLSFGLTLGYQSIIFNTANILVDVTQKWWYYVAAIGGIGVILVGSYAIGFVSLKRDRLVDQIK